MESSAISKAAGDSSGMSSAEVSRLEMQLRNAKSDLAELQGELDRSKAASSGSEKDKAAVQQQLQDAPVAQPALLLQVRELDQLQLPAHGGTRVRPAQG